MRNKSIFILFYSLLGAIFWMSSTGGAGNIQGADLTGSPLGGGGSCGGCHSGGSFSLSISAELVDAGVIVNQYQPGKTYIFRIKINTAAGSPARFGFQAVALTGADNAKAGVFGTVPTGFRKTLLQGREYIEHSSPRSVNTVEIPWTAPSAAVESVRFYVSGIAANNNGSSSGDASARLSQPLQINPMVTSTRESLVSKLGIKIIENPIEQTLQIVLNNPESSDYIFSLLGIEGKTYWKIVDWLPKGENKLQWQIPNLPPGLYFLKVDNRKGGIGVLRVIRQ